MPSQYKVFVPVELAIELEARNADNAFDRAQYIANAFIKGALPYKLSFPGMGAASLTITAAPEDDDQPAVEEIKQVATTSALGALPTPADYAAPHYGVVLVPAEHPSQRPSLGGSLRGEEWGA